MAKTNEKTKQSEAKQVKEQKSESNLECQDVTCPTHGSLKVRGRSFAGTVISKNPKRICIEFARTVFIKKFERYAMKKTRIHARLPDCLANTINIGDYVEVRQCRQLSKIINFVVVKKIRDSNQEKKQ